jgi:hypothetical protein
MDRMWQRCLHLVGEHDFREKARDDLNAFGWHLYLLDCLRDRGHQLLPVDGAGPDICLVLDNRKVWIEAIAVKPGTGEDEVSEPPQLQVYSPPDDKILLRHTAGLKEKLDKYQYYVGAGYVSPNDPYLIGLNVGHVRDADMMWDDPISYLEQAVFGLGDEQCHLSVDTGEVTATSHRPQPEIRKPSNGASVQTQSFLGDEYSGVSGVLYCTHNIVMFHREAGRDVSLLHNPMARNKIPHEVIKLGREKWVVGDRLRIRNWTDVPSDEG